MASYMDMINAAVQYQKLNLERRGDLRQAVQGSTFEELLRQSSSETEGARSHFAVALSNSPISPAEVENELKFKECLKFVLGQEGSKYVKDDGGRESSRYGILQSTARYLGYKGSVKNISKTEVEKLYKKLWDKSGAAGLDLPMALVHFDTFVNSPASAQKLLKKSQGNLENYITSREQRYTRLAEARPETYSKYVKGWKNRIASLKNVVAEYNRHNTMAAAEAYRIKESGNLA